MSNEDRKFAIIHLLIIIDEIRSIYYDVCSDCYDIGDKIVDACNVIDVLKKEFEP